MSVAVALSILLMFLSKLNAEQQAKDHSIYLERMCALGSHYVFDKYVPSEWEKVWQEHAEEWQSNICEVLRSEEHAPKSAYWLHKTRSFGNFGKAASPNHTVLQDLDPAVFSRFVYKDICQKRHDMVVNIEPIVGLLRNPYAICGPKKPRSEDRSYLLPNAIPQHAFSQMYPGRKYLFDLGTAYYATGLAWFVNEYESAGITFDEIYGWEVKDLNHTLYWEDVPKHIIPRVHLYNHPVQADNDEPGHPFAILKQIYHPGDFVVVKLDIDFPELEQLLVDRLLEDKTLRAMIAEFYFEMHHNAPEMAGPFGKVDTSYPEAVNLLQKIRQTGLRLHCWP